jgi:hypothetical protein
MLPRGLKLFGIFLWFAATMASLAGFLLLRPGTPLDAVWALNPRARQGLAPLGPWAGIGFFLLSALSVYIAILWRRRRFRGWRLAVIGIAVQAVGDAVNFLRGDLLGGFVGVAVASLLLAWLLSRPVKAAFR